MAANYSPTDPTPGAPRATSPTETERWAEYADTIADVDTRLDTLESGTSSQVWVPTTLPPWAVATAITWPLANRLHWGRVTGATADTTALRIRVHAQSGNVALGIWSPSGSGGSATPGTRKVWTGSVACPAVGVASVALGATYELAEGDFVGFACDNTTASFWGINGAGLTVNGWSGYSDRADLSDPGDTPSVSAWTNTRNYWVAGA